MGYLVKNKQSLVVSVLQVDSGILTPSFASSLVCVDYHNNGDNFMTW